MSWLIWNVQSHGVPKEVFQSSASVQVERVDGVWRFVPVAREGKAGLMFLPGGMVDPRAYFPLARGLAERGHPVGVVTLPFRIAPSPDYERDALQRAQAAAREIDPSIPWALAGHSRGAAIASRLVAGNPTSFQGLALIGTTHPRVDLSHLTFPVLKIGGTRDCVADRDKAEAATPRLPAHTEWIWIEGANHAQFGWYGFQLGDCGPSITREEQQERTRDLLIGLLDRIGEEER